MMKNISICEQMHDKATKYYAFHNPAFVQNKIPAVLKFNYKLNF